MLIYLHVARDVDLQTAKFAACIIPCLIRIAEDHTCMQSRCVHIFTSRRDCVENRTRSTAEYSTESGRCLLLDAVAMAAPERSAHPASCSVAAARKVSPAASSTCTHSRQGKLGATCTYMCMCV